MSDSGKKETRAKVKSLDEASLPMLPSQWRWVTLNDLSASEPNAITDGPFGSNLKTSHYTETGPRVIRLQNIGDGFFSDEYAHISESHFEALKKHRIVAGDIAIAALGESLPRSCVIPEWVGPAIVKADCPRFRPNPRIVLAEFVNYGLNSPGTRRRTSQIIHGVGRPRLNLSEVRGIWLPLAPLNEQRRIVAKIEELFSDLDAGVAALKRARANLKRYRAAVLKAAVEGKLTEEWRAEHPNTEPASKLLARILTERRQKWEADQLAKFAAANKQPPKNWRDKYVEPMPPDTSGLPELPEEWCWATLHALAEVVGGITKDQKKADQPGKREVPYLRVANVQRGFLDLSEMKSIAASEDDIAELRLEPGDMLFTEGGDRDKLGRGWVWSGEIKECVHQNHIFRGRLVSHEMQPRLVSHHGNTFGKEWFIRAGKQTTNLASINLGILRQFPVPVAPGKEQAEIIAIVDEKLSQMEAAETAINHGLLRASRLRQSILKQAFEGKLVPQVPKDEPASVLLERLRIDPPSTNGKTGRLKAYAGTKKSR